MRLTSIAVYNQIKDNGLLARTRFQVYDTLFRHGPLTQSEIEAKIAEERPNARRVTSYHKRCAELERQRVIATCGERTCRVTGINCLQWDVTTNLPTPLVKRVPLRSQLAEMGEEAMLLRSLLNEATAKIARYETERTSTSRANVPLRSVDEYADAIVEAFVTGRTPLRDAARNVIETIVTNVNGGNDAR